MPVPHHIAEQEHVSLARTKVTDLPGSGSMQTIKYEKDYLLCHLDGSILNVSSTIPNMKGNFLILLKLNDALAFHFFTQPLEG